MMNKKQLTISLAILGVLAIVVICIGIFGGVNGGTQINLTTEQKDILESLQSIGETDINDIEGFKDGVYVPKSVSNDIFKFEKEGNILRIQSTGNGMLQGNAELLSAATVIKDYGETKLYTLGGLDFTFEIEQSELDISKLAVTKLTDAARKGNFSYRVGFFNDIMTLKVVGKDLVLVNDTEFIRAYNIGEEQGIRLDGVESKETPTEIESNETSDENTVDDTLNSSNDLEENVESNLVDESTLSEAVDVEETATGELEG